MVHRITRLRAEQCGRGDARKVECKLTRRADASPKRGPKRAQAPLLRSLAEVQSDERAQAEVARLARPRRRGALLRSQAEVQSEELAREAEVHAVPLESRAVAPLHEDEVESEERESSSSPEPPPAEEIGNGQSPVSLSSVSPSLSQRTPLRSRSCGLQAAAVLPAIAASPERATPRTPRETCESGSGGSPTGARERFEAAVLERLRKLCGEQEEGQVLAEYIVAMVAGNTGREEMAFELKPFFPDHELAGELVDWVDKCKWRFLGVSPARRTSRSGSPRPALTAATLDGAACSNSGYALLPDPLGSGASAGRSRQANFGSIEPTCESTSGRAMFTNSSAEAPTATKPPQSPPKRERKELLEAMTKQLQLILTKLSDKGLDDEAREKYQALAQNVQLQMTKISQPPTVQRRLV